MAEGARSVDVPLRRLDRWLSGFTEKHGAWAGARGQEPDGWQLAAADGTTAFVAAPTWLAAAGGVDDLRDLPVLSPPFGVLLLRRAGYAVAAFRGADLVQRKVGTRHVHGRTAAGGWSQQRYARRRAHQADEVATAAAEHIERILGPLPALAFLVTGGDRPLLAQAMQALGPRLAGLPVGAHLAIGTPDAKVLAGVPDRVLAVRVDLTGAVDERRMGPS